MRGFFFNNDKVLKQEVGREIHKIFFFDNDNVNRVSLRISVKLDFVETWKYNKDICQLQFSHFSNILSIC